MVKPVIHSLESARQKFNHFGDAAALLIDPRWLQPQQAGPAIYICDVQSGRVLILLTAAGALHDLSEGASIDEATYLDIRAALQVLLDDVLNAGGAIHPDTRRGVIFGAAFCTTETRGFQLTWHHGSDVQYLLLRYPDAAQGGFALTPMPVFKLQPLSKSDLEATATHALLSEHLNFPERFAGGKPMQFIETKRNVLAAAVPPLP